MLTGDDGDKQTAEVIGVCLLSLFVGLGRYDVIIEE